jgi:carboxypeptidase C (cathepsin A)
MSDDTQNTKKADGLALSTEEPTVTQHSISVGGRELAYTATAGMMPYYSKDKEEHQANMFFTAYTLNSVEDTSQRPLMFVFNGGPGSSSVWLHLGAVGPKRVIMEDEGWMPAPPYRLEDNAHTWLDLADLVFIDPVGTGYSRAKTDELNKQFWNVEGDIKAVGEFIRMYLTRYQRWHSPLYLAGESYGTTRAAGLAGHLVDRGIGLNGIILISTILSMQTARFGYSNDLPYVLFLPTYTATAWYHGKLPADLQERPLTEVLAEVEAWAEGPYNLALMRGDRLPGDERAEIVEALARYTGLSTRFIEQTDLRIIIHEFCKELLRDENRTVGRLDSRFTGIERLATGQHPTFDPSYIAIVPPYTSMLNQYMREALGYETDREYNILSFDVNQKWEWDKGQFTDTSEKLRAGLAKNPYLKIFLALGYYDLATPYFAAEYTFSHMGIDPELRPAVITADYEAGHMVYLDVTSLEKLKADVAAFMQEG